MSLNKSKCWYSNNCLHFLKCTLPLSTQCSLLIYLGGTAKPGYKLVRLFTLITHYNYQHFVDFLFYLHLVFFRFGQVHFFGLALIFTQLDRLFAYCLWNIFTQQAKPFTPQIFCTKHFFRGVKYAMGSYPKRLVVQNKSNLILKIFCTSIYNFNYLQIDKKG